MTASSAATRCGSGDPPPPPQGQLTPERTDLVLPHSSFTVVTLPTRPPHAVTTMTPPGPIRGSDKSKRTMTWAACLLGSCRLHLRSHLSARVPLVETMVHPSRYLEIDRAVALDSPRRALHRLLSAPTLNFAKKEIWNSPYSTTSS
jgi:hypothetical protein